MGYQENEEVYLTLPRKDLQELCRKHGLPWNRNKPELAHLLVVHFTKQKETRQKRSKPHQQKASSLPSLGVRSEISANPRKETDRTENLIYDGSCGQKSVTSEANGCASTSSAKVHDHDRHQMVGKVDINVHMEKSNSTKVTSAAADTAYAQNSDYGVKDSACPKYGSGIVAGKPPLATSNRENRALQQLRCEWPTAGNNDRQRKPNGLKNYCQNLSNLSTNKKAPTNLPVAAWRNNSDQCSSEIGLASSSEISAEVSAPFQFFARAEEGIKLYVDLNSSPSNWIKSFKDGICIYQRAHQEKSWTICDDIGDLGMAKHLKTSHGMDSGKCRSTDTESQVKGFEGNNERKKSSLTPTASSGNDRPSRFSALASCCGSVELPECPNEGNPVVSRNYDSSCSLHCPSDQEISHENPQNPETAASVFNDSNAVLAKSSNETIHHQSYPAKRQELLRNSIVNVDSVISHNSSARLLGISLANASETSSITSSGIIHSCSKVPGSCSIKNKSGDIQISSLNESADKSLLELKVLDKKMHADHQYDGQPILDSHVKDMQSNGGCLAVDLHGEHSGRSLANSISENPALISSGNQNKTLHVKEKTRSRTSKVNKMEEKTCKRANSSEIPEEFQRKRHHSDADVDNGPVANLRSAKTLSKKSISDIAVLQRRSLRLVSKPLNS